MGNENLIAACPNCGVRYRIEAARLRPEGVRLRCSKCEAAFRVTPPAPQAERAEPAPARGASITERPRSAAARRRGDLVLLADADVSTGKVTANVLADWGFEPVLVHDGVEAILTIQRLLPRAVILDAGLPKMFGFQICELMKRNASLSTIPVVLVGAIHHEDRYRRAPSEIYGADAYVERPQLPEALRPILRGFGLAPAGAAPETPAAAPPAPIAVPPKPRTAPAAPSVPEPVAPVSPAEPPVPEAAADPAVAAAERLARIIVSDIVLYNAEKFEAGVRDGNVVEALESELGEGRTLFQQRVDARVRTMRDFLAEELLRVARSRGMTA
jgi:predicted Zn finger-like uncharacterized protein